MDVEIHSQPSMESHSSQLLVPHYKEALKHLDILCSGKTKGLYEKLFEIIFQAFEINPACLRRSRYPKSGDKASGHDLINNQMIVGSNLSNIYWMKFSLQIWCKNFYFFKHYFTTFNCYFFSHQLQIMSFSNSCCFIFKQ